MGGTKPGGKSNTGKGGKKAPTTVGGIPLNSPLLNPGQPLSGQQLYNAAKALSDAQTQGTLSALASKIAQNNKQSAAAGKATSGYFNQLGNYVTLANNNEKQIGDSLNQNLASIGSNTQNQLNQFGQDATNQLNRYTPQGENSGLSNPALQSLTSEIARQKGLAAQSSGASQMFGAIQGGNYQGLSAAQGGVFAQRGQEALKNIAQAGELKNEPLVSQQGAALANRGALLGSNLGKLRQQEINNAISEKGLDIKASDITAANQRSAAQIAAANARNTANINAANSRNAATIQGANSRNSANNSTTSTQGALNRASREKIAAANRQARQQGKPPVYTPTGVRTLSPDRQQAEFNKVDKLRALIKDGQAHKQNGTQISQYLQAAGYPKALIDTAFALQGWGYVTPAIITELNNEGLIVGGRYKRGNPPHGVLGGTLFGIPV